MNNATNSNMQQEETEREPILFGPVLISLDVIIATHPGALFAALEKHLKNEDGDFGQSAARERGVRLQNNDWFSAHRSGCQEFHVLTDRASGTTMVLLAHRS